MEIKVNNELNYTELVIEEECNYQEDYQLAMIRENKLQGLVSMQGRGVDQSSQYLYDITGMQSLKARFEKEKLQERELRDFLSQLLGVLEELRKHMLDINRIMLDPGIIYCRENTYYFCYYPAHKEPLTKAFHGFTEYLICTIDYADPKCVYLACELHKGTMEEQYNLGELLANKSKKRDSDSHKVVYRIEEDEDLQDGESAKSIKNMIRDTSLNRFWKGRKKQKREDWEDILIEESI